MIYLFLLIGCLVCQQPTYGESPKNLEAYAKSVTIEYQYEQNVFIYLNRVRQSKGLAPLVWSDIVATYARNHSYNMASGLVPFGHQGVAQRYAAINALLPSTRFGENVAYNKGYPYPGLTACQNWIASPEHYANIIGDYNTTGVGVAVNSNGGHYFTQIFIKHILPGSKMVIEASQALEFDCEGAVSPFPICLEDCD
jgi:uncharacterized protein YkwD